MRMKKDPWQGTCQLCGMPDMSLATTKGVTSCGVNYVTIKCCNHCSAVVRLNINHTIAMLRADARVILDQMGIPAR